ncbi:MAG TPA: STAS domain-containing protein [Anaerolineales bacterium]|jgi:anti-anti-sigma regulatory factor|nr:STAS domain-containing protein [Anaerolineales bacterium]
MNISVSQAQGKVPVTIIKLDGQLDGQNYQDVIARAREAYAAGWRDFLIDMSDLTYISSAGLVALHSVSLLIRGEQLPDTESGWSAYRSMGRSREAGIQQHIKLLNPREGVKSVLDMVGFTSVFEIFTDLDKAVQSF